MRAPDATGVDEAGLFHSKPAAGVVRHSFVMAFENSPPGHCPVDQREGQSAASAVQALDDAENCKNGSFGTFDGLHSALNHLDCLLPGSTSFPKTIHLLAAMHATISVILGIVLGEQHYTVYALSSTVNHCIGQVVRPLLSWHLLTLLLLATVRWITCWFGDAELVGQLGPAVRVVRAPLAASLQFEATGDLGRENMKDFSSDHSVILIGYFGVWIIGSLAAS
eukprot:2949628-Rhodomonas_salina.1